LGKVRQSTTDVLATEPRRRQLFLFHETTTHWFLRVSVCAQASAAGSCESAAGGGCSASISIRICRDTSELRQRDEYASRGLLGSITLHDRHSHALLPPCSANGAPRRLKRQPRARSTVAAVFTHIGRGKRYGTPSNRQI